MIELFFRVAFDIMLIALAITIIKNSQDSDSIFCARLRLAIIIAVGRVLYLVYEIISHLISG